MIAKLSAGARLGISLRCRPNENINQVLAARIHKHCNGAASNHIQAAALQRKSFIDEIVNRRREVQLAVEPRLNRVLIGRHHVFEMSRL